MSRNKVTKLLVALCATSLLLAGTAGSALAATATPSNGTIKTEGPCDKKLSTVPATGIIVGATPSLDLKDQADALLTAAKVFNKKYNGIGGHCFDVKWCDTKFDPNVGADCARKVAASNDIATLSDTDGGPGEADIISITKDAGIPRVGVSPGTGELGASNSYIIGAGGAGTTFMMVPPLTKDGFKKIYMIGVDSPQIDALKGIMGTMAKAYGAEIVGLSKVTAGTTDYQQFVLAAQDAGADSVILPLGDNEANQVLQAAQQLGSKLEFSVSLGTFGREDIKKLGSFAKQMHFNAEIPPATASTKTWPVLKNITADLASDGSKENQKERLKTSPVRSWIALWHLKTIMENSGSDLNNMTRESVTAAMNAATDVDTFGLIPPWTPNKPSNILGGVFSRVSNPWYYNVTWNGKDFVIAKDRMNVENELNGVTKYDQPTTS
ncbi:MAG TPA: ABC transporter substrate-binding protein [Acidimicrobiia bacterium]|nr:ABC transporter substrate-binding protein [Acidimicrobiia bacterium]